MKVELELIPSESRKRSEQYRAKNTGRIVKWALRPVDLSSTLALIVGAFDSYFWDCDRVGYQTKPEPTGKRGKPPLKYAQFMDADSTALERLLLGLAIPWLCERPNDLDIKRLDNSQRYEGPLVYFINALLEINEVSCSRSTVGEKLNVLFDRHDIKATLKLALTGAQRQQRARDKKAQAKKKKAAERAAVNAKLRDVIREKTSETFTPSKPFRRA